jgi:hypothetical protein
MKMRPPVDLHFASVEEIAPSPQAVLRQIGRLGVGCQDTHSAPRHRFDMHRPERLYRLRTRASGRSNAPLTTTLASFLTQKFGLYLLGFCDAQGFPPTDERRIGEPMLCVVATCDGPLRCHGSMRIDHHLRLATFWKCFGPTGDSPMQQRTRYGTRKISERRAGFGRLPRGGIEGKIKRVSPLPELRS